MAAAYSLSAQRGVEPDRPRRAVVIGASVRNGRDIEPRVLAEAVRLHLADRVLLNGHKTVVFRR